jgi:hypothetical protein
LLTRLARPHRVNTASMVGLLNAPNMGSTTRHAVAVSMTEIATRGFAALPDQAGAAVAPVCGHSASPKATVTARTSSWQQANHESQLIGQAVTGKAVDSGKVSSDGCHGV